MATSAVRRNGPVAEYQESKMRGI
ncbi:MAG: hypothetical protein JWR28_3507, partial [Modestobacter sp.]|nr:hypothetical protein [Modestobacter sp.]